MKINYFLIGVLSTFSCASLISTQNYAVSQTSQYKIAQTSIFSPQNKKVLLLKNPIDHKEVILFQTNLRVNTDGSPLSYHPYDPRGKTKALNNVCNAIVVKKGNSNNNLCLTNFSEAISVFERWRDAGFLPVPPNLPPYHIIWQNVLASREVNGRKVPCTFKSGQFNGYFGSLTALQNGLTSNKGECDINNQVNPMTVPALVLVGGQNVVKQFGAKVGDLLVAYNLQTKLFSSAIIGDTGPKDNLGEGSVFLNMKLLGKTVPPTNKAETFRLSIENTQVLVAIIPASQLFQETKPYTAENIEKRVTDWQKQSGFATPEDFIKFMELFQPKLK